jgi:hypothetical protein
VPKNKGKKWREYNVPRKSRKKILKNLTDEGRQKGREARWEKHKRRVIGIKDGEWYGCFESTCDASRKTGIEQANISAYCLSIYHKTFKGTLTIPPVSVS